MWPAGEHDPTVHLAGTLPTPPWHDLDPPLRRSLEDARAWLPLTVEPVGWATETDIAHGIVATLSRDATLWLEFGEPRRVSVEDRQLVTALVGHLSLAMQHVRQFELARDTSLTLQRSMLAPTELPAGFAVRYEPAVSPLEIGGDWYDVLPVGDDRIGIIVGDCVGRGLSAAAVMGQLRSSARALLLTGASPARLLEQLDSVAAFIPDAFCTTVFVAILDTRSETLIVQQRRTRARGARRARFAAAVVDGCAVGAVGGAQRRATPASHRGTDRRIDPAALHRRPRRAA